MNDHENPSKLDRILLEEEALLPTSGFAVSVMEAIQQQAIAPKPIVFPWKLALPGFAALLAALILVFRMTSSVLHDLSRNSVQIDWFGWLQSSAPVAVLLRTEAAPLLLALAISFVCVVLCHRLAVGPHA